MQLFWKTRLRKAFRVAIAFTPWLVSMFTLYWLEYGQVWTTETAHRGKTSSTILAIGMVLSLVLHSRLTNSHKSGSGPDQG